MHHAYLDKFAGLDSLVHRLDPRAKVVAVVVFMAFVISVPRHDVLPLVPYFLFPGVLIALSGVPVRYLLKRVVITSPLLLSLIVFPPLFSREVVGRVGGVAVTTGMLNAANLALKFCLCLLATLVLTSTTRFDRLLRGLQWMGLPRVLVVQLSFLYRYLFVMADESIRMRIAGESRLLRLAPLGRRLRAVGGAIGVLFLRTLDRSERIYAAMASRGFDGTVRILSELRFRPADALFLAATLALCCVVRFAGGWS